MGFTFTMEEEKYDSAGTFEALPEGNYDLELAEAEIKDASTGTKMLACQFKVLEGEYVNRRVFRNFPLTEKAIGFVKALYDACGIELMALREGGRIEMNIEPGELIGQQVSATVTIRKYNDNTGTEREGNDMKNLRSLSGKKRAKPVPLAASSTTVAQAATASDVAQAAQAQVAQAQAQPARQKRL